MCRFVFEELPAWTQTVLESCITHPHLRLVGLERHLMRRPPHERAEEREDGGRL